MLTVDITHRFHNSSIQAQFELSPGETLGIYGKSGIGKSTLLRSIAGLTLPTAGEIKWCDVLWTNNKNIISSQDRKVGLVFQDCALFPNLTVEENLRFSQQTSDAHFNDMVEVLEIASILHKKPNFLSGGQKQRTAIGRAIACDPELILLDEPFSALDDEVKENIKSYLKSYISNQRKTAIIASHDRNDLAFFTNNILRLKES